MSKACQWRTAIVAVIASLVVATSALAQMPTSPYKKGAPFPEPDEELYGVAVNGKLYVIGGWGDGKARGVNYEYDPATDSVDEEEPDAAAGAPCGACRGERQDLRVWWFRRPGEHRYPGRRRMGTHRRRVGVQSGHRFMEAAGAAARQARFRDRRGSGRQDLRDWRRHDDGRVQGPVLHGIRACPRARHERRVRPRHEQVGEPQPDVGAAQSRLQRRRQRQDLRHRRPHRPRLHPVGHQHGCGRRVQPRIQHVEYPEGADADCSQRWGLGYGRPQDLCGRRRGDDHGTRRPRFEPSRCTTRRRIRG